MHIETSDIADADTELILETEPNVKSKQSNCALCDECSAVFNTKKQLKVCGLIIQIKTIAMRYNKSLKSNRNIKPTIIYQKNAEFVNKYSKIKLNCDRMPDLYMKLKMIQLMKSVWIQWKRMQLKSQLHLFIVARFVE